jgi:hypothetical protein
MKKTNENFLPDFGEFYVSNYGQAGPIEIKNVRLDNINRLDKENYCLHAKCCYNGVAYLMTIDFNKKQLEDLLGLCRPLEKVLFAESTKLGWPNSFHLPVIASQTKIDVTIVPSSLNMSRTTFEKFVPFTLISFQKSNE